MHNHNEEDFFGPSLGLVAVVLAIIFLAVIATGGGNPAEGAVETSLVSTTSLISELANETDPSDQAWFRIEFNVTAIDEDIYIPSSVQWINTGWNPEELKPLILHQGSIFESTANRFIAGWFVIKEGETEQFTQITVARAMQSLEVAHEFRHFYWNSDGPDMWGWTRQSVGDDPYLTDSVFINVLVPEPTQAILLAGGIAILVFRRKRRTA